MQGNYRKIISRVDAESLLEHYGARNLYRKNDELVHSCLIDKVHPHHKNGDESPSASMNAESRLYSCYSYGGGDVLWFIQEMEDVDRAGAFNILSQFVTDRWDDDRSSVLDMIKKIMKQDDSEVAAPTYSPIILRPWAGIHPYLTNERQLNLHTLQRYNVGYDEKERVIIFPHFWQGNLVGYQKRALTVENYPKTKPDKNGLIPKYKNSPGFPKDSSLFNFDVVQSRGTKSVVVVESVMSVLKAESWFDEGHTDWGNVLCTFGGKVTNSQIDILRQFESVILFFDNDQSGWSGVTHLYEGLKKFCKLYTIELPEGLDLADLDCEIATEVMTTKRLAQMSINSYKKKLEARK